MMSEALEACTYDLASMIEMSCFLSTDDSFLYTHVRAFFSSSRLYVHFLIRIKNLFSSFVENI